ncbi:MAG: PilZ domain-containing protein [Candidatus Omnitrophica bacterium]|nr:PilZ domain-containing protein [Candidatus Omnitrophota bacterium]MBU1995612.1 PilZ domain-containing protein [Candidatus Omnitrophota bacterium]MBU4333015.1 PilZ domain-containing protein [Candidatus Omnitrophota bacterium]
MKNKKDFTEHRQYIRLNSAFPVSFKISGTFDEKTVEDWTQGYTCNVSKGGICLEASHVEKWAADYLKESGQLLELRIRIPLDLPPIKAIAQVVWMNVIEEKEQEDNKYQIGVRFTAINKNDLNRMVAQARWFKFSFKTVVALAAVLFIAFIGSSFREHKLREANKKIVQSLVVSQQEENQTNEILEQIILEKSIISKQIESMANNVEGSGELKNQYEELVIREEKMNDQLKVINRRIEGIELSVVKQMYKWLKTHQSPTTGLVSSFEGDVGIVKDWAFIYDQALIVTAFLLFDDVDGAKAVLNFFQRQLKDDFQGFNNGYYYDSGEVSEWTVHCGPNIWVGIAIMQYANRTGDHYYLPMARKIADWLITIQDKDPKGGLKGGPEFAWFATEHNLDAYAFFDMLEQVTGEEKYVIAKKKVFSWLKEYSLIPNGKDYKAPPINRGRGDATIATDTYAWSLAAIGSKLLDETGMDPEQIMNFAEEHCLADVVYIRPSGMEVNVKGFDFSKIANLPRGGLVSPEWTSQMIISFKMLSDYFKESDDYNKAGYYREKSEMYLSELNKLIISSPSARGQGEGCLPYATLPNVDTGHGWLTPHGESTCSVAGTAYGIMAIKRFNPLMFEFKMSEVDDSCSGEVDDACE